MTPPKKIQERVRKLVDDRGAQKTGEALGVSRETAKAVAGGLLVQKGTLALVEQKLAEMAT